jgi:hypothetical protein
VPQGSHRRELDLKQAMAFRRRLTIAFHELEQAGIARGQYLPPLYGLLLRLGVERAPPHYCSLAVNAVYSGAWFGPLAGFVYWLMVSRAWPPGLDTYAAAVAAGALYGVAVGAFYRASARRHRLSTWESLRA